jgi:hypothetical protein
VLDIQKRIGTVDVPKEQGFQQQNAIPFQKPSEKAFANLQECVEGPGSRASQQVPILKQSNRIKEERIEKEQPSEKAYSQERIEGVKEAPETPCQ